MTRPFTETTRKWNCKNHQEVFPPEGNPQLIFLNFRVPRSIEIVLLGDNIDSCKPGDEIEVIGVYMHRFDFLMNIKHGFPIFNVLIQANAVRRSDEIFNSNLPDEDK